MILIADVVVILTLVKFIILLDVILLIFRVIRIKVLWNTLEVVIYVVVVPSEMYFI